MTDPQAWPSGPDVAGEREDPPVARLAVSQLRRVRRIVDAAVALAEDGGYDNVRLRDLAGAADVALGTLYKYFSSKEDILLFALAEDAAHLESMLAARPAEGPTPEARLASFFVRATRAFTRRPHFARAVLRAIASGDGSVTALKVAAFHLRMTRMIVAALRDEPPHSELPLSQPVGSERERAIALTLNQVWYASLVGWAGGLHPARLVTERVETTVELLLGEPGPAPRHAPRQVPPLSRR